MAKPTITVDAPNVRRLAEPDRHAVLVPPNDPETLASAIDRLLADPTEARRIGHAARSRVQQHFTWARHVDELTRLFETLDRR